MDEFTSRTDNINPKTLINGVEAIKEAMDYLEKAQVLAESQIDIEYPWNYDPDSYLVENDGARIAIKWTVEAREQLESTSDEDLQKIASRMKDSELAFVKDWDDPSTTNYYKALYLCISIHDALISWLCEKDPEMTGSDPNNIGEEVYWTSEKEKAVKRWYGKYTPMNLEEGDSSAFKDKWEKFFKHRRWIMHGHPDAHFDDNLALTALFFLGLTGYIAGDRYNELVEAGQI